MKHFMERPSAERIDDQKKVASIKECEKSKCESICWCKNDYSIAQVNFDSHLLRSNIKVKLHKLIITDTALELALCRIGRDDIIAPQSDVTNERRIQRNIYQERQASEEIEAYKGKKN